MYIARHIFLVQSEYFSHNTTPAPTATVFSEELGLWKLFLFILSSALYLARDWDGPNTISSKSLEGFDESISSSVWINWAVAFTCSDGFSQAKDFDSRMKSLHLTWGHGGIYYFHLPLQKLRQWYCLSLK